MVKVGVKVMPREVILDTQGRAVEQILKQQKMHVGQCRVGRFVELDFPTESQDQALKEAKTIAEKILYNPLIETIEVAIMTTGKSL